MESIFAVRWEDLELEHVRAFLEAASDEGLTWEAKGHERPHPGSMRKATCGFANSIGGYLIVGADRADDGTWSAAGVDFLGEEPTQWLAQQITDGLRPLPAFDVKSWMTDDRRALAVVQIEPAAVTPCMTASGEVYVRVAGATVKVTDPRVLSELIGRGQTAEARAAASALTLTEAMRSVEPAEPPYLLTFFALAPTGVTEDVGARLFTEAYANTVVERVGALPAEPLFFGDRERGADTHVTQDSVIGQTEQGASQRWIIRAHWSGAVGVTLAAHPH